jgi:hypothetical protein
LSGGFWRNGIEETCTAPTQNVYIELDQRIEARIAPLKNRLEALEKVVGGIRRLRSPLPPAPRPPKISTALTSDRDSNQGVSANSSTGSTQGLSQNELCRQIGESSNNLAAKAKRHGLTSQEYLEQWSGWRFDRRDRKFYPPT